VQIQSIEDLNNIWQKFSKVIISNAKKYIPNTKKAHTTLTTHSFTATKLYKVLKDISSISRKLKSHNYIINITAINQTIEKTNELTKMNFSQILDANHAYEEISSIRKALYTARRIENSAALRDKIQHHIQNRYDNFNANTSKMINSILHKHTDLVHFYNIVTENDIITEPDQILEYVQIHFEN
jgi:hypothetical protein